MSGSVLLLDDVSGYRTVGKLIGPFVELVGIIDKFATQMLDTSTVEQGSIF